MAISMDNKALESVKIRIYHVMRIWKDKSKIGGPGDGGVCMSKIVRCTETEVPCIKASDKRDITVEQNVGSMSRSF